MSRLQSDDILGQSFTLFGMLKFAAPRMLMSLFIMSYLVADGALISHYLGTQALAALNLVYPMSGVLMAFGIMLSAGGGSVVARRLGAGDKEGASRALSSILIAEAALGAVLGIVGWLILKWVLIFLGIGPEEAPYALAYQHVALSTMPFCLMSVAAQTFFTTAGFPKVGLAASVASGIVNVLFDILFMGPFGWGMAGASLATALSWAVCAIAGIVFFSRKGSPIPLILMMPEWLAVKRAASSGVSEMVTSLSHAVTLFLFNTAFQKMLGIDGVAALTVAMYSTYVFNCLFYGFCEASAPIVAYKYGNKNWRELKRVFVHAVKLLIIFSGGAYGLSLIFAKPVLGLFVPQESDVYRLVLGHFKLFALSLLFLCPNMFAAYFFTAFGDGKRAAVISFCRTFLFMALFIELLPYLMGELGLWLAVPASELAAFLMSVAFILRSRRRYGYDGAPAQRINEA